MAYGMALFLLGLGLGLLALGIALGGIVVMEQVSWPFAVGSAGLAIGAWVKRLLRQWRLGRQLQRAQRVESELAEALTPQLLGDYTPYVIEAAEKLGAARDVTAVPALLTVLEQCVDTQRPGWREVSEALANALAQIGDRRALPLLYRLENVRGIGFIPAIRSAIAAIEPQTSLLRAGCAEDLTPETLLRPAQDHSADKDPRVLLRAIETETH